MFASAAGGIKVEIQSQQGEPIKGFTLQDCEEVIGDSLEKTVRWKNSPSLEGLQGKTVRLKFEMRDADIYAFQFKK